MAYVGVRYAKWAKITNEPDDAKPRYGDVRDCGALVGVTDNPAYEEVKQFGDDRVVNHLAGFKECPLDCEVTEMELQVFAEMIGATYTPGASNAPGTMKQNKDDTPPYGGFGYIRSTYTDEGGFKYAGVYYPKAKAVPQGSAYQTRGDSVVFTGNKFKLNAIACKDGDWIEESDPFEEEADAKAWVDARVKKYTQGN